MFSLTVLLSCCLTEVEGTQTTYYFKPVSGLVSLSLLPLGKGCHLGGSGPCCGTLEGQAGKENCVLWVVVVSSLCADTALMVSQGWAVGKATSMSYSWQHLKEFCVFFMSHELLGL